MDKQPSKPDQNRNTMKSPMCLWVVLLGCLALFPTTSPAETNALFQTIDTTHPILSSLDPRAFGPSKDDPDGRWGSETGGLILSLRFQETAFLKGDPINAIILIRNVTNKEVVYAEEHGSSIMCDLMVTNVYTKAVLHGYTGPVMGNAQFRRLQPFQQVLYLVRLDQIFTLPPGRYSIQALMRFIAGPRPPLEPLTSGAACITIIEAPGGAKGHATSGEATNSPPR
jgi:hypothetical protein